MRKGRTEQNRIEQLERNRTGLDCAGLDWIEANSTHTRFECDAAASSHSALSARLSRERGRRNEGLGAAPSAAVRPAKVPEPKRRQVVRPKGHAATAASSSFAFRIRQSHSQSQSFVSPALPLPVQRVMAGAEIVSWLICEQQQQL